MIRDVFEHVRQIRFRIDTVQLRRSDQRIHCSRPTTAIIGARKKIILTAESYSAQRPFGGIVIDFQRAILAIAKQRRPSSQRVMDRNRDIGFFRQPGQADLEPLLQIFQQR